MSNFADERKTRPSPSLQWSTGISDHTEVTLLIYSLEAITRIGKNFPIIFLSLASLNTLMAANDFLTNSIEFGVLNSLFAASGFIFLAQLHQSNKIQPISSSNGIVANPSIMEIKN